MSEEWKSPSEESEDLQWAQIVHNVCGLPIELCECPENPLLGVQSEKEK